MARGTRRSPVRSSRSASEVERDIKITRGRLAVIEAGGDSRTVLTRTTDGTEVEAKETADSLKARLAVFEEELAELDARRDDLRTRFESGALSVEAGADGGDPRPRVVRDQAQRTLDAVQARSGVPDEGLERAERLLKTADIKSRDVAAEWITRTGDPHYEAAFTKLLADPERGHLLWTDREAEAYRGVEEFRAMSLTDAAGGFMVPFQLDPSIILTSAGSINPLRRLARVVTATGDVWNGVSSAGASAEWIAEATEVADGSPTIAQPSVPVHKFDCFVPYSFEVGMDGANFLEELRVVMVDAVDQLQATAFTTGTGSGQPTGIITALVGGSSIVASATTDTFARADVFAVQNALPARFQARAQWCANLAIINAAAQFELSTGSGPVFPEIKDDRLLRKPLNELSNMDGVINATQDNYVLLYGDFSHLVIADRIGATLELIPNLVGANRRPTGQRGAFLWGRVGADSVVDGAFRLLNVT